MRLDITLTLIPYGYEAIMGESFKTEDFAESYKEEDLANLFTALFFQYLLPLFKQKVADLTPLDKPI